MSMRISIICLFLGLSVVACSNGHDDPSQAAVATNYDEMGPYAVGNQTIDIMNTRDGRALTVEIWYPAAVSGQSQLIQDFTTSDSEREQMLELLAAAPQECTRRDTSSSQGVSAVDTPAQLPLVIFSHCFECTRYSSFSLAERLASHGIAVAAPDHAMNTLFDTGAMIDVEFLAIRANDVSAVLDALLDDQSMQLPQTLMGRFDASKVGIAGHSYGALTTGKVLHDDARFIAGLAIAAPVALYPGVSVANIDEPLMFMIAEEDNSIGVAGNQVMRANFDAAVGPAWKIELADAGHWSFSDIAGIVPQFNAGCGEGERQTVPGEPFTYLDNVMARDITSDYGVRFFAAFLLGDETARQALQQSTVPGVVSVESR